MPKNNKTSTKGAQKAPSKHFKTKSKSKSGKKQNQKHKHTNKNTASHISQKKHKNGKKSSNKNTNPNLEKVEQIALIDLIFELLSWILGCMIFLCMTIPAYNAFWQNLPYSTQIAKIDVTDGINSIANSFSIYDLNEKLNSIKWKEIEGKTNKDKLTS